MKATDKINPFLVRLGACREGVEWAADKVWKTCPRGDWMLWLAAEMNIDRKLLVQAACDCAELSLKFVKKGEDRPRKAIKTARLWADGEATIEEVRAAAADASAAVVDADADGIAALAAAAAAYVACAAKKEKARSETLLTCADKVRERISIKRLLGIKNKKCDAKRANVKRRTRKAKK